MSSLAYNLARFWATYFREVMGWKRRCIADAPFWYLFHYSIEIWKKQCERFVRSTNETFFGAAVFQKCCRGVGEQPTFAKQIKLYHERKQKSKRKSEESQLPSKSEGCNKSQGFRGNCDSQGKLGMCPSLAEPYIKSFPQKKQFWLHFSIKSPSFSGKIG